MSAPPKIVQLVNTFYANEREYTDPGYVELRTRTSFIDPFFKELGWDVGNDRGVPPSQADVVFEDTIRADDVFTEDVMQIVGKRPDYSFRIDGKRRFYVEAKKPAADLEHTKAYAYQVRSYGWSSKLPVSILTDFQEFVPYDCRLRPEEGDPTTIARIESLRMRYDQYIERWDDIAALLSRDAVMAGSLDKFTESKPQKGTLTVDAAFLKDISEWRRHLAQDIAHANPGITQYDLNYAVQMTINRIIFLRICEDRGIERPDTLLGTLQVAYAVEDGGKTVRQGYAYRALVDLFRRSDALYNSGLFHFGEGKYADTFTPNLRIGDETLAGIIKQLYYPYPYKFDVIPIEILGQVYEQFLGDVIVLNKPEGAGAEPVVTVEQKPEVRKAGGVYYTPTYIVDYIVEHTAGKLLAGKTADEAAKLRIVDPACGSGSFLIGAYSYLLDWHLRWYMANDPEKWARQGKKADLQRLEQITLQTTNEDGTIGHDTTYRLTRAERRRILLHNIYGVDIDTQAVEVTKLSLLIKMLEGEHRQAQQLALTLQGDEHKRLLPDLGDNIKCGNSLIGPDFYTSGQATFLDETEERRINVFDWQEGFPEIMRAGGFDAVIGNPPYIRIQTLKEWAPKEVDYYKREYVAASKGNYDIYVVFVERGLSLLNKSGHLGFILPNKFFNAQYGEPLRNLISKGEYLEEIVHFGDEQVFSGASTYTCLLFMNKQSNTKPKIVVVQDLAKWERTKEGIAGSLIQGSSDVPEWNITQSTSSDLLNKLNALPIKLADVTLRIFQGLITGADSVFILTHLGGERYLSNATSQEHTIEDALMHPLCKGSVNIKRYFVTELTKSILFPYKMVNGKAILLLPQEFAELYPHAWRYLHINRGVLEARERGKWKHDKWYAFGRSQNLSEMEQAKLLTPSIANRASFTFDDAGISYFVGSGGGGGGAYGIVRKPNLGLAYQYLLGILNSNLLDIYLKSVSSPFSGGYYAYNRQYIEQLPIRTIDFTSPTDKAMHAKMVQLVDQMLLLHKQLATANTPYDKERCDRLIKSTDREIDNLVYKLYDLTAEEISIVEGAGGRG